MSKVVDNSDRESVGPKHSDLPWHDATAPVTNNRIILSADGRCVATFWHPESAPLVVRAVNNHAELLAAARAALSVLEVYLPGMNICKSVIPKVASAIRKAEGG